MIGLDAYDLKGAQGFVLVANTPIFLLKKLNSDTTVSEISRGHSVEELSTELQRRLSLTPSTFRDATVPLVLLVAYSKLADVADLDWLESTDTSDYRWFSELQTLLLDKTHRTSISLFQLPPPVGETSRTADATVNTSLTFDLGGRP